MLLLIICVNIIFSLFFNRYFFARVKVASNFILFNRLQVMNLDYLDESLIVFDMFQEGLVQRDPLYYRSLPPFRAAG